MTISFSGNITLASLTASGGAAPTWDYITSPGYTYPSTTPVLSSGATVDNSQLSYPVWDLLEGSGSITLPTTFMQDLILGNVQATFHIYFKNTVLNGSSAVLVSKSDNNTDKGWNLYLYNGYLSFVVIDTGADFRWYVASAPIPLNTWTLVSMVFDGTATGEDSMSSYTVYINGVAQTLTNTEAGTSGSTSDASIPFTIGYSEYGPVYGFAGSVAYTCAVRSVQTADQIAALAANPLSAIPG